MGSDRPRPTLTSRAAILALVVCGIALSLAYPLREYVLQRAELAQLKEERERTQQNVSELERRHEELREPDRIEREARERLHYQYPDERAYIIVGDEDEDAREGPATDSEPWFTRLWKSVQEADQAGEPEEEIPEAQPPDR
ncbi:FtsB family cell division protein [Halostreptopolyspora alba]|uniref:Septum formation initiator family protein n=1 Tax=Halostreptopolyspora alba TaxID=2487137 RepID=A0A3N0E4T1_9ACTN|nr:septum formation initiator family protein [Nocardiopsaceae bacterium YIM 96095]